MFLSQNNLICNFSINDEDIDVHNVNHDPVSGKRYKLACTPMEDSNQPVHPCSLTRVCDGFTLCSQGSNVS